MDQKPTDFRKSNNAMRALLFRVMAIALVLYWLYDIVRAYFAGGPDAPTLTLLLIAVVIMGGGSVLLGVVSWIAWKRDKENAKMTDEEIAEMEALRAEDEEQ